MPLVDPESNVAWTPGGMFGYDVTPIEDGDEDGICLNAAAIIKADYKRAVRFVEIWKESD